MRPAPPFPGIGHAVLLVLGFLLIQFFAGLLVGGSSLILGLDHSGITAWTLGAINTLAAAAVVGVALRIRREPARRFLAIAPFRPVLLAPVVAAALGLAVVLTQVDHLIVTATGFTSLRERGAL